MRLYVRVRGCAWDQGDEVESEVEGKEEKVGIGEEDLGEEFVVPRPSVLLRRHLLACRAGIRTDIPKCTCASEFAVRRR